MIHLVAAVAMLLTSTAPQITHRETVQRAGATYDVRYSPRLVVTRETVGAAAGTRFSQQKCRWTIKMHAHREISRANGTPPLTKTLSLSRSFSGETTGDCRQNAAAVQTAQNARRGAIQEMLREFAQADRPHVGTDIDAAHALALN